MTSSPRQCKSGAPCEPVTLREALYCQCHHSAMRFDEIARRLGISPSALTDFVNPYGHGSPLPMRHLESVLALTPDNLAVVTFLASRQRAVVYRVPQETGPTAGVAVMVREFGELLEEYGRAHADNRLTAIEMGRLRKEGREVISAIASALDDAERRVVVSIEEARR